MEVVFASSDQDQHAFDQYFAEMPRVSLPYSARQLKDKLSAHFGARGIPTLVVVDATTGELVTKDGRAGVSSRPGHGTWRRPGHGQVPGRRQVP